jgi:hypothetical protein
LEAAAEAVGLMLPELLAKLEVRALLLFLIHQQMQIYHLLAVD